MPVIRKTWIQLLLAFGFVAIGAWMLADARVDPAGGVQFDLAAARELGSLTVAGPLLALACAFGARLCLKRAFPEDIRR